MMYRKDKYRLCSCVRLLRQVERITANNGNYMMQNKEKANVEIR